MCTRAIRINVTPIGATLRTSASPHPRIACCFVRILGQAVGPTGRLGVALCRHYVAAFAALAAGGGLDRTCRWGLRGGGYAFLPGGLVVGCEALVRKLGERDIWPLDEWSAAADRRIVEDDGAAGRATYQPRGVGRVDRVSAGIGVGIGVSASESEWVLADEAPLCGAVIAGAEVVEAGAVALAAGELVRVVAGIAVGGGGAEGFVGVGGSNDSVAVGESDGAAERVGEIAAGAVGVRARVVRVQPEATEQRRRVIAGLFTDRVGAVVAVLGRLTVDRTAGTSAERVVREARRTAGA
jgi:hypothetical protein